MLARDGLTQNAKIQASMSTKGIQIQIRQCLDALVIGTLEIT